MKEIKIKPVENNKSKGKTYTALMKNYKEAMENGYYGEAELVVYAFLEDRLRAFLYYSEVLDRRNSKFTNDDFALLYGDNLDISNISSKIKAVRTLLKACSSDMYKDNPFVVSLKRNYSYAINSAELKNRLKKIDIWCDYRNEIVHAMFNKDLDALRNGFKEHVEKGYELGRYIDKQVSMLKRA